MKNRPLLALALLTALAVVILLLNRRLTQPSSPASRPQPAAPIVSPIEQPATNLATTPATPTVTPVGSQTVTPSPLPVTAVPSAVKEEPTVATARIALEDVRTRVRQYGSMFNGNPVGTNREITDALDGGNPKHVRFLEGDAVQRNAQGELIDQWGTPYFFHQLSGRETEIRSAGPDRRMWTSDDIVMR